MRSGPIRSPLACKIRSENFQPAFLLGSSLERQIKEKQSGLTLEELL